ncbi:hypothetical protein F5877DRAFT_81847 [Lentinula edodes]|nr:hypothetical protein F5877DRAFT_81847 [Lentinula edodes]
MTGQVLGMWVNTGMRDEPTQPKNQVAIPPTVGEHTVFKDANCSLFLCLTPLCLLFLLARNILILQNRSNIASRRDASYIMIFFKTQTIVIVAQVVGFLLVSTSALPHVARTIDGQDWILESYTELVPSRHNEVQDAFKNKLEGIRLGSFIAASERGLNSEGVYDVRGKIMGKDAVVKVMKDTGTEALGEVLALKDRGELLYSGYIVISGRYEPVIVMVKVPGKVLSDTREYQRASDEGREKLKKQAIKLMCKAVADIAVQSHLLHYENNIDNTLVTVSNGKVNSAKVCDYGASVTFKVAASVTRREVYDWCKARWTPDTWIVVSDEMPF